MNTLCIRWSSVATIGVWLMALSLVSAGPALAAAKTSTADHEVGSSVLVATTP